MIKRISIFLLLVVSLMGVASAASSKVEDGQLTLDNVSLLFTERVQNIDRYEPSWYTEKTISVSLQFYKTCPTCGLTCKPRQLSGNYYMEIYNYHIKHGVTNNGTASIWRSKGTAPQYGTAYEGIAKVGNIWVQNQCLNSIITRSTRDVYSPIAEEATKKLRVWTGTEGSSDSSTSWYWICQHTGTQYSGYPMHEGYATTEETSYTLKYYTVSSTAGTASVDYYTAKSLTSVVFKNCKTDGVNLTPSVPLTINGGQYKGAPAFKEQSGGKVIISKGTIIDTSGTSDYMCAEGSVSEHTTDGNGYSVIVVKLENPPIVIDWGEFPGIELDIDMLRGGRIKYSVHPE